MNINVTVRNKTVTAPSDAVIVCGNNDYTLTFDFDEEWRSEPMRTARFVWFNGNKSFVEEETFTGSVVTVPILSNTRAVFAGVYAGVLRTTTAAKIVCEPSILCYGSDPAKVDNAAVAKLQGLVNKLMAESLSKADIEKIIDERLEGFQGGGGGVDFKTDATLKLKDGILSVNTTNEMERDNTLPITSAGVYATVGNIEALLKTI